MFAWAFLPARYLPGNRARHLRLRLHPGKGFAHLFSLWLRWGRLAALRRSARIRRSLSLWRRIVDPAGHSIFLGRAHYRHGLRVLLEEHLLVMAPPRAYKTAFLADVILRCPGPVIATTKADICQLTGAARAQLGPVHVFNPQHIGGGTLAGGRGQLGIGLVLLAFWPSNRHCYAWRRLRASAARPAPAANAPASGSQR